MPWKDVTPMDQKLQFVSLAATGRFTITQLCDDFDISRKTGHKWLARHATHGAAGLKEHSGQAKGSFRGQAKGSFRPSEGGQAKGSFRAKRRGHSVILAMTASPAW
jgi:transposase-like protein